MVRTLIQRDTHCTNGKSVIAVVAFVPVHVPRNEVQDVSIAGVVRVEIARPIEAVLTRIYRPTPAAAGGGQEQGAAVRACYQIAVHAVTILPSPSAIFNQLLLLFQ